MDRSSAPLTLAQPVLLLVLVTIGLVVTPAQIPTTSSVLASLGTVTLAAAVSSARLGNEVLVELVSA